MRKSSAVIAMFIVACSCAFAANVYTKTAATIAAGATSVTITNPATSGQTWTLADVYGTFNQASGTDTVSVSVATAAAPTVFYVVNTATATGLTSVRINLSDRVVTLDPGSLLKASRADTNAALNLLIISEQVK